MGNYYIQYLITSVAMILLGGLIVKYIRHYKLDEYRKLLGVGAFWLKLLGIILLIFGGLMLIVLIITYYYQLQYDAST